MSESENQNGYSSETDRCHNSTSSYRLDELFKACDTRERGMIGPAEFSELCDKFGISSADSVLIFADLDHDGDGYIDFEDFSYGFRDFLTPGSRRGSLQIPVADQSTNNQQLLEMERKHASARTAWKHFMKNVGPSNIQPFISNSKEQLYDIDEEIRHEPRKNSSATLEKTLTSLITDVHQLHEEYKTLENSFRKEREVHAAQLVALGEELDQQLAKAEAKAKAEARQEAQRQMDAERKKIASEIEGQLADLSSQIRTFQKVVELRKQWRQVEEWLTEEEAREKRIGRLPEDHTKLHEAENENRNLRSALVEAQMKATLLQTQLTQKRNEYLDLFNALHSEKIAASEYKSQVDLMQNHLVVLSEANRVLCDANDCLSTQVPLTTTAASSAFMSSPPSTSSQQDCISSGATGIIVSPALQQHRASSNSCPNSLSNIDNLSESSYTSVSGLAVAKQTSPEPRLATCISTPSPFFDTDKDSGRSTLLDEIRAEGDGSPLPSGIWTCSPQPSAVPISNNNNNKSITFNQPLHPNSQPLSGMGSGKSTAIMQNGNSIGKIGSSCCSENKSSSGSAIGSQKGHQSHRRQASSENTYRSFGYGEDSDLYEALAGGDQHRISHLGNRDKLECENMSGTQKDLSLSSVGSESFYPHRTFKVILAGDAAVGKTTFIERICYGHFTPNLSSTIGVDFRVKTIELDGKCVALQLWDTAGQERFRSLTKSYFRRADGVILMYDVSNERTFANIRNWIHNVEEGAGRKVPIVLSGNKVDLREDKCHRPGIRHSQHHYVSQTDGEKLASQCGAIFVETSPKTGHNVFEAIMMLAKEMSQVEDAELRNSLQLTDRLSEERLRKKGCCSSGSGGGTPTSGTVDHSGSKEMEST